MAVGVAILTTVASAAGLTQQVAGRTVPHLAAYHAALAAASAIALIAAGVARFVDDRAAAPTMIRPDRSRHSRPGSRSTAAAHAVSAGCHHLAATGQPRGPAGESADHQNHVMLSHQAVGEARYHLERRGR